MGSVKCSTIFLMGKQIGFLCFVLFLLTLAKSLHFLFPVVNCACPPLKSTDQRGMNVCVKGGRVEMGFNSAGSAGFNLDRGEYLLTDTSFPEITTLITVLISSLCAPKL